MPYSKEEKAMWLEDWHGSGKKAWAYAKENGLIPQTFCSWVKRETKKKTGFVEIPAKAIFPCETKQELVIEKGCIKIRVPLSCSKKDLQTIISAFAESFGSIS
jgi:4-aminobutyrate aminotransferase-like enzyme